ncbi:TonB-dependent receptor [Maricurvus nonylphenolicus]|uniref:TonB-dependent receptor n=1 Tax=Maricurvus nonylphenolicus TaxID=1008307 RepID=UPI0036F39FFF
MFSKKQLAREVAAVSAAVLLSPVANAESFGIEEIVVTAQKRAESAQEVPVAISAFNEDMVTNTGVDTLTDIIPMIPGLTGSTYGIATNTWAIRGISTNDWSVGSEPSVGVFFDDAYIGRNGLATGAFFDIDRIEVVKGPQGTLFGRNASVGAISIVSNKPEFDTNYKLGVSLGNEGQREYDVVANLEVSEQLALRAAYHGSRLEGVWDNVTVDEEGFSDNDSVRLMALWTPADDLEALLTLSYSEADTNMHGAYNPSLSSEEPGEEFPDKVALNTKERETNRTDGVNLRLTWDLNDDLTLTSITDTRSFTNTYNQDLDGGTADATVDYILAAGQAMAAAAAGGPAFDPMFPYTLGTGGVTIELDLTPTKQRSISQEFRLNGSTDSLDWFVGASYFSEDVSSETTVYLRDTTGTYLAGFGTDVMARDHSAYDGETRSLGVYGDAKWMINEEWSVTAGLRWSQDKKDWCTNSLETDAGFIPAPTNGEVCSSETWSEVTPRLIVDYALSEDVMLFASVSKGYKGGGFNATAIDPTGANTLATSVASFEPETNTAYELGLKSTLLDGRMQFNASAYFNDYEDLQIQKESLGSVVISNAAAAETQGLELELTYMPVQGLTLMANYTYLDADFQEGETTDVSGNPVDLKGKVLTYAPENTFSVSANYEMAIGAGTLNWFAMYNWQDDFYFDVPNTQAEGDYGLTSAKVTFIPDGEAWDLALGVDNLTDEEYAVYRQDIGLGAGQQMNRGMPRLVRAEFNLYF